MQSSHTPPFTLKAGVKTQVRWARKPGNEGKLLILVHGFKGSATHTWENLPGLLCLAPAMAEYDIVCYGYDSLKYNADESANDFHGFVNHLLDEPTRHVNALAADFDRKLKRGASFQYSQLCLIGHSLGACVIRRALLNQLIGGARPWPKATKTIFYAPAHGGARILLLWSAATFGVQIVNIDSAAKFLVPALQDLEKGSDFLNKLESQTKELCETHACLKAPLTFWAPGDRVVFNECFAADKTPTKKIPGTTHISVCKPERRDEYVELLIKEISA